MRFFASVIATALVAAAPLHAQSTRTISSEDEGGAPAPLTKPLPVARVSYSDLKKSYKIDPSVTLGLVKADPQSNTGRALEITGSVSGVMETPAGRTVILNSPEGLAVISTPREVTGSELMTAGRNVRVLVLAGANIDGAATLSLIAATDNVAAESLFRSPYGGDDLTVVPPAAEVILPPAGPRAIRQAPDKASAGQPSSPRPDSRPRTPPASGLPASSSGLSYEAQKNAFKNLVRRYNRKLKETQVEEIATALLGAGQENRIDPRFLAAVIAVESDFDIYCLSSSGAMGLGQLMPFNLKEARITNAWDPKQNIYGTARLLRGHLNDYKSRADGTLLAVAAYNAGPGAVRRAGYKVPNGQQVQRYVWKVYYRYKEFAPELFAER